MPDNKITPQTRFNSHFSHFTFFPMIQQVKKGPQNVPSVTMHQVQIRNYLFFWKGIGTYPSPTQAQKVAAAERKVRGTLNVRVQEVQVDPK